MGVFVSIVSTKIPFKGTGKEYIGDDVEEIASAVKVKTLIFLCHRLELNDYILASYTLFCWLCAVGHSAVLQPTENKNYKATSCMG